MKQLTKQNGIAIISLLLALPTAYFIVIAVLKYELGVDGPFDSIAPLLESWGIKESLGWNINLLILFGPLLAFCLTIFQLLGVRMQFTQNHFLFQITVRKRWLPLLVAGISISLLAVLFTYLFGENCICS
jgi:hypothetical protein